MRRKIYIGLMAVWGVGAMAQETVVVNTQALSKVEIWVGEPVEMRVDVMAPESVSVVFPTYNVEHPLAPNVEVLRESKIDTSVCNTPGRKRYERRYMLTSFDSTLYYLRPYVLVGTDTVWSKDDCALKVKSVEVDTAHVDQFNGPYAPEEGEFEWTMKFVWLGLLWGALLWMAVWVSRKWRHFEPLTKKEIVPPVVPVEQAALASLATLRLAGDDKAYYVALTDVLRQFIAERWGIQAKEQTSREMLVALSESCSAEDCEELAGVLGLADRVKFAKWKSGADEKEEQREKVATFVRHYPEKVDPALLVARERIVPLGSEQQRRYKMLLWVSGVLCWSAVVILAIVIIIEIYENFF